MYCNFFCDYYKLPVAIARYFNVYGPNEWHKDAMRSMVCKGYEQIQSTGRVRLFASDRPEFPDGGQRRDRRADVLRLHRQQLHQRHIRAPRPNVQLEVEAKGADPSA